MQHENSHVWFTGEYVDVYLQYVGAKKLKSNSGKIFQFGRICDSASGDLLCM